MKNVKKTNAVSFTTVKFHVKWRSLLTAALFAVIGFSFSVCDTGNSADRDDDDSEISAGRSGTVLIKTAQIPAGAFMMGSPKNDSYMFLGETQHQVNLTEGFSIGKYQVTQAQWIAVMGDSEDRTAENYGKGKNYPIYNISWYDAVEFCNKLSVNKKLSPVYSLNGSTNPAEWGEKGKAWDSIVMDITQNGYRLPTEAEWEYACRGDYPNKATEENTKPFGIEDGTKMVGGMANFDAAYPYDLNHVPAWGYKDTSAAKNTGKAAEVGSYKPNNYDIYDMHGNVWEWCWDWYDANYYLHSPADDPKGPDTGSYRVIRGGYWFDIGQVLRSAYRHNYDPSYQGVGIGLRLARSYADSIEDIEIDDWTWNAYSDGKDGGKSSISMKQGSDADNDKINSSGKIKNNPGIPNGGYAGLSAAPNAENLASLKTADLFSFKCKGDGKKYIVKVPTSDIEDGAYYQHEFTASSAEKTVEIPFSALVQPDWGNKKNFNKNNITNIEFHATGEETGEGDFNLTIWDLSITGLASSVDDYSDLEPPMESNSNRAKARVGGTAQIGIPSSLPAAGPATFSIDPADADIAQILSQNSTSCSLKGLKIGTVRVNVKVGSQSAMVLVAVSPSEASYKLPAADVKKLGSFNDWDAGSSNRPDTLPTDYANYNAEPTTQLAWYWRNKGGTHGMSGEDCGIDFLAYYVDPGNTGKRGWVRTTYGFGGWHYDLNGATNDMTDGVQTNGNVKLQLTPEFVYDNGIPYLQITHTLTNTGSIRLTGQKFGASADIMIHGNDYAPLTYLEYGALMTNAVGAATPSIKFRLVCQNVLGVNNVSTLWLGTFGSERSHVYEDRRTNITDQDSAMNFSYQNITLEPGESKTFVVRFTQIQ